MANDGVIQLQYHSGSGTNRLVFRGRIPAAAVAGGYIADLNGTYAMATDGSSSMVDGNGTTVAAATQTMMVVQRQQVLMVQVQSLELML
jgi:hypothetical protein